MSNQIQFNDGGGYERYMGEWSRLVAHPFLDWLAPAANQRWLDVGCGNGAFTRLLFERCAPASVHGVDPSEQQLAYARAQASLDGAVFEQADAMALPHGDDSFDIAVMPLVIFFVPEPERGVAEMQRVTAPGGLVAAYAWDMPGGGFPYHPLLAELRTMDKNVPAPPSSEISRIDLLHALWEDTGLVQVESRSFTVQRTFADFDDYWKTVQHAPSIGNLLGELTSAETTRLQDAAREALRPDEHGPGLVAEARANGVKGITAAITR